MERLSFVLHFFTRYTNTIRTLPRVSWKRLGLLLAPTRIHSPSEGCTRRSRPTLIDHGNVGAACRQIFIVIGGNHVGPVGFNDNDECRIAAVSGDLHTRG